MKNLDIDSRNIALDDYIGRQVKIEYTGGIHKGRVQGRTHTVTVAYTSLSKKLQAIHRLGGKIINVSIPKLQVNLAEVDIKNIDIDDEIALIPEGISEIVPTHGQPLELEVAVEIIAQVDQDDSISPEEAVIITEGIIESVPEIINQESSKITDQIESVDLTIITENVSEKLEVISKSEVIAAQVLEIAPQKVVTIPENITVLEEVTIVTPEKSKSSQAITPKSKSRKSSTSTKTKQGFNTKDDKTQTQELKSISDVVDPPHKVEELKPEQLPKLVSESVVDKAEKVEQVDKSIELELSSIPEAISEIISEQLEIVEPVAEIIVQEISEAIAEIEKVIPETNLKSKSSSPKKSAAKTKKSKAAKIADEILQVTEETVVEANIDLPISKIAEVISDATLSINPIEALLVETSKATESIILEIANEEIATSTPESSSIPESLAKSKKSKSASKSANGFNKSKGDR
jgi:hypothetical protein